MGAAPGIYPEIQKTNLQRTSKLHQQAFPSYSPHPIIKCHTVESNPQFWYVFRTVRDLGRGSESAIMRYRSLVVIMVQ